MVAIWFRLKYYIHYGIKGSGVVSVLQHQVHRAFEYMVDYTIFSHRQAERSCFVLTFSITRPEMNSR